MRARVLSLALGIALFAGACSDDAGTPTAGTDPTSTAPGAADLQDAPEPTTAPSTSTTSTTSMPPAPTPPAYTDAGPYEVGVLTVELPTGSALDVWYPAGAEAAGDVETYNVRDFIPVALQEIVSADVAADYSVAASRDAPAETDGGPYPVVLNSHGFSGFRTVSSELLRHLASWGIVVASPDHQSRNLNGVLGGGAEDPPASADELRASLAALDVLNALEDGPLSGAVDTSRVVALGHSAGGGTVLTVASDPEVDGFISMASGAQRRVGETDEFEEVPIPAVPSLWMAGALDGVAAPAGTRAAFERAASDSWLWVVDDAGHNAFDDICEIGKGAGGLIGLADASGLGDLVPESLRTLATDGCEPPNRPVTETWPAIKHGLTAFTRWVHGTDSDTAQIGPEVADGFGDLSVLVETNTRG